ncbi:MAG: cytochrome c biogenesis heme-transporting ATPase CcmA [Halioglobus sp.]|nr:cytochrome c biogenesis heme-transporting ATPase CcmA [Halioglobus sp.]
MPSGAVRTPLLATQSLGLVRGGRELFRDLTFEVCGGELWQVHGGNGAGKTSLMRILCGLSRYGFEGEVLCSETPLYLGHQPAVKALLTPRENLQWHVSGAGLYDYERIDLALARVGLCGYEDSPSHTLSAGQRHRVNLARLFLSSARLWLLDEPFTAIDKAGVNEAQDLLSAHVDAGGAVIMTSHQTLRVSCKVHSLSLAHGVVA